MNIQIQSDPKNLKVFVQIDRLREQNITGIRKAFFLIGTDLRNDTRKDIMRKPRFGRVYKYKGRKHIASVRGEAPANRSGFLRDSVFGELKNNFTYEFGYLKKAYYGKFLETGKLDRPALRINIDKNKDNIRREFEHQLQISLGAK